MIQSGRDIKLLSGGMDTDTESRQLGQSNYRFLLNARNGISTEGNFGAIEDMMGNVLVDNIMLGPGRNKSIGSFEDTANQSLLYCIWNENGYHAIFRWFAPRDNFPLGYIEKMYRVENPFLYSITDPDPLGFTEDDYITGINLVDDTLFWTNAKAEPKSANLARFNLTGKKFKFNLYLYPDFAAFQTTYTISYDSLVQPMVGLTTVVATSSRELYDRVEEITNAINTTAANQYFRAVNKINFVEIEAVFEGDAYIEITEVSTLNPIVQRISKVVPQNFVPDYRLFGGVGNYTKLQPWHTNNIKSPARCGPHASYGVDFDRTDPRSYVRISNATVSIPIPITDVVFIGGDNDSVPPYYDNAGEWNLGFTTQGPVSAFPSSCFSPTTSGPYAFDLQVNAPVAVAVASFDVLVQLVDSTNGVIQTKRLGTYTAGSNAGDTFIEWKGEFEAVLGRSYAFFVQVQCFSTPLSAATVSVSGTMRFDNVAASTGINLTTPYLFRTKYIYKFFENSVYSAYSTTPLPVTYKENSITIDFSDEYLSDVSYLSFLRNVVLAYSPDNGTTWYDLKKLEPYQFCVKQTYSFFGNEFVRTVPESEAALPFHALPLTAKSQEYADERIWYGGLTEGYDNVLVDAEFDINYPAVNDPTIYPPERQIITPGLPVQLRGDAEGSFWERGYDGYIGIVYYDDYDRKTFVNIPPNGRIYTKYFNEDINGSILSLNACTIDWAINSPPPSWATKYQFVRTKNIRCVDFLEWSPILTFADSKFNTIPYETYIAITATAIGPALNELVNFIRINGVDIVNPGSFNVSTSTVLTDIVTEINNWGVTQATLVGSTVYVQAAVGDAGTMNINGVSSVYAITNGRKCDCYALDFIGIADYGLGYNSKLTFPYQADDFVIFKQYSFAAQRVLAVVGNIVYVKGDTGFTTGSPAGIYEPVQIYTPNFDTPQIFYEFGECKEVYAQTFNGVIKKYHRGETQDQTPTQPATGTFGYGNGNVWYRQGCSSIVESNDPNVYFGGQGLVQRKNMNDFTEVVSDNNGRTNAIADVGFRNRPTAFKFTDQYISNTEINGTNAIQPLNEKQLNTIYGLMEKMQVINNDILKLIFANSYQVSIYVRQAALQLSQGSGNLIGVSDQVAGEAHIIQRTLGTINPESIAVNDEGDMMGYDENEGVVWISSGNGLLQISDRGMKSDWKRYSNQRRPLGIKKSKAPAIFDIYHDDYIITLDSVPLQQEVLPLVSVESPDLPDTVGYSVEIKCLPSGQVYYTGTPFTTSMSVVINTFLPLFGYTWTGSANTYIAPNYNDFKDAQIQVSITNISTGDVSIYTSPFYGGQPAQQGTPFDGVTVIYNKRKGLWTEYASFVPEMYGRVRDYIVSFKDGGLWVHDQNSVPRNFYGVQYPRQLRLVSNKDYPKVKDYKAMSITGIGRNSCPSIVIAPYEGNPTGMQSSLSERFFQVMEGIQYSNFQKDLLTPGFATQLQALVNGRNLKGQNMEITIEHSDTSKSLIYSVDVIYFYSENS